ncbi:hypothetical protein [Sphingosinicella terrae]|uniref:hypothetical protein n=1 Tax=Sphingosinicella terrae TaxID=2172047 RepID=UPI0013B3C980|nr:hypothetical protein [Sphingosinicella terrae]
MSAAALAYESFRSDGRDEWMMRIGDREATPILFVPPLFEEMNRTRALIGAVMRRLAARGHACWLPDLAGTGESERPLEAVGWGDWRNDVMAAAEHAAAAAGRRPLIAALRGGALLDDAAEANGRWRMAPVAGASLVRDMVRAGIAGVEWAGYAPSEALKASIGAATPAEAAPMRVARLASDAGAADVKLPGPALWRRSEPGASEELAEAIAADLAHWGSACAAC